MLKSSVTFLTIIVLTNGYVYETKWFSVPLDHFSFARNETFKIKYLVNDTYWDGGSGPIFFYTGNEVSGCNYEQNKHGNSQLDSNYQLLTL